MHIDRKKEFLLSIKCFQIKNEGCVVAGVVLRVKIRPPLALQVGDFSFICGTAEVFTTPLHLLSII